MTNENHQPTTAVASHESDTIQIKIERSNDLRRFIELFAAEEWPPRDRELDDALDRWLTGFRDEQDDDEHF